MTSGTTRALAPGGADGYHPRRRLRRRRGMTQAALAQLIGVSFSYISMVERRERSLTRLDHITAIAEILRVSPAELAPVPVSAIPDLRAAARSPAPAFPPVRSSEVTMTRHARLVSEFLTLVGRGDTRAAGIWLRRTARDPAVSPWLLLDLLAAHLARKPAPRPHPSGEQRLDGTSRPVRAPGL
jgi:transcriptional regulator with XRE-family HTH domain